ncbi:Signal transduction histidine kinase [Nocardiopsis flavescens]|uniref:histidine kinase n=1 Tax=Nocardiopsis flavescens TaxID=758803 RepID=A0A1M6LV94_9ACTN|nr:histidine kinase [Nocardiopsis flavescens]SHJ75043.1 Signal transduction histidine kinase [Nocardiopsis flavescens]
MRIPRIPAGHAALACVAVAAPLCAVRPWLLLLLPVPLLLTGRLSGDPRPAAAVYAALAAAGAAWLLWTDQPAGMWVTGAGLTLFAVPLPWLVGRYLRSAAALERAGWERARILENEAGLVADRARLRERSRIAGELHDAVGHELGLLSLRAGALELAGDLPGHRRAQAAGVREAAARAADRLAESVGVLRADGEPAPLRPADETPEDLVSRARDAGMDTALVRTGPEQPLPVLVDRAVHRVVQEALTNSARHAPGAAVRVRLETSADAVTVRVAGTAPREGEPPPAARGGTGLVGLRERVRLAGGTLRAGPSGPGWTVEAVLPLRGGASSGGAGREEAPVPPLDPHRRLRRRTAWALGLLAGIPAAAACAGYGLLLVLTVHQAATATLEPAVFAHLRPGQGRAEVEALLPESPLTRRTDGATGRECLLYRSSAQVFDPGSDRYRLCFDEGELVSAEAVRR